MSAPAMHSRRRSDAIALAILAAVALVPRVLFPGSDPPPDVTDYFLFDTGGWAHNARNRVLFGHWILDQHNPGLLMAPLYTAVVAAVFAVFGTGLAQISLLNGVAGFGCCVAVYALMRAEHRPRQALLPAALLGMSYFMITQNRIGLTESLQLLLISATAAMLIRAGRGPRWLLMAGACFGCSLLAKPNAAIMGPIAALWLAPAFRTRDAAAWRVAAGRAGWFALGAVPVLAIATVTVVVPLRDAFIHQASISIANAYTAPAAMLGERSFVGWGPIGLSLNPFFLHGPVLVTLVALLASARIAGFHGKPPEAERLAWIWLLAGLTFVALLRTQPDRRLIFLMPPLAILAATAMRLGTLHLPPPIEPGVARGKLRAACIGVLLGAVAGFYGHAFVLEPVFRRLRGWNPELAATIGWRGTANAIFAGFVVGGVVLLLTRARLRPAASVRIPAVAIAVLFLLTEPVRFARHLVTRTSTIRGAARQLDSLTARWQPAQQVMMGPTTLSLESRLRAVQIYPRRNENLDAWERLRPNLAVAAGLGRPPDSAEARTRGFVPCLDLPVWPDRNGRPKWYFVVYARPGYCTTMPADSGARQPADPASARPTNDETRPP